MLGRGYLGRDKKGLKMNSKLKEALDLAGINPYKIWPENGGMVKIQFRESDSFLPYIARSEMELPKEELAKLLLKKYENAEIISRNTIKACKSQMDILQSIMNGGSKNAK